MTEHNTSKRSLSQVYRRFAGSRALPSVPDTDDVLELSRIAHADEAAAPLCADLLRFSRALEPASAQLSADVAAAFDEALPGLHRRALVRRGAARVRRWRGVAAVAATVLAVVGVWTLQRGPLLHAPQTTSTAATSTAVPDRIFAAFNDSAMAATSAQDEIFRDKFSGPSDQIFRAHDG
jgi:hypothetical protein